jgi:iron complex transport system permease protein
VSPDTAAPPLVAGATSADPTAAAVRRRRPALRLGALAGVAALAAVLFLVVGVSGGWDFVLPRRAVTLATMAMVGCAVAVSTVLFQTVTHNRILTPAIMGFDSLYVLVQSLLVVVLGAHASGSFDGPARFGLEVGLMVVGSGLLYRWLFLGQRRDLHLLVLAGVIFGVLFRSISTFVQRLLDPNEFVVLQDRLFASFTTVDEQLLVVSAVLVAAVSLVAWRIGHTFDVLALGRETAVSLGVPYQRTVALILVLVAVLVSVSTALVGPVTFFGLLVANLAYRVAGSERHRWTLPTAALLGVVALVGGQTILQHVFGLNTAISVIVEFLGGITLIVLLVRGART